MILNLQVGRNTASISHFERMNVDEIIEAIGNKYWELANLEPTYMVFEGNRAGSGEHEVVRKFRSNNCKRILFSIAPNDLEITFPSPIPYTSVTGLSVDELKASLEVCLKNYKIKNEEQTKLRDTEIMNKINTLLSSLSVEDKEYAFMLLTSVINLRK